MPAETIEAVRFLFELGTKYAEHRELKGTPAERAASAALVVAVMHHGGADAVRALTARGLEAKIKNTKNGFELHLRKASVEVEREVTGVRLSFHGFGWSEQSLDFLPFEKRYQVIPISALRFEIAIKLGRAILRKLVAMLKVAAT
jgi:hypothetical protein